MEYLDMDNMDIDMTDLEDSMSTYTDNQEQILEHTIPEDVYTELEENIMMEIDEYVKSNLDTYSSPDFHDSVISYVTDVIYEIIENFSTKKS